MTTTTISWETLEQYAKPVPRYTSYPTAPSFHPAIGNAHLRDALSKLTTKRPLSLYVHFPFCHELCWYCGCNTRVNRKSVERQNYIDWLLREMVNIVTCIDKCLPTKQIHFGGGTPNYMSNAQFRAVMQTLRSYFDFDPTSEMSIELDPRLIEEQAVETFADCGINRVSLGIQDFNPTVQKAINRVQPYEMVKDGFETLRCAGINQINADLILGLPHQNEIAFRQTLEQLISLKPSRIAVFNFAYLPQRYAHMKLIKPEHLPSTHEKFNMMKATVEMLTQAGYIMLGMDHFALPEDSLSKAFKEGRMHRNFQGYTTMPEMDMIGFGASSISMFNNLYIQNHISVKDWQQALQEDRLATYRGVELSVDDIKCRAIIERVMCKFEVDIDFIENKLGQHFDAAFPSARNQLNKMMKDGLLEKEGNVYHGTFTGRLLIRNVAAIFDRYLEGMRQKVNFSKAV